MHRAASSYRSLPSGAARFSGARRERDTMPWDVLVNRLDRYLRLGYIAAVLAGLVLTAEVMVRGDDPLDITLQPDRRGGRPPASGAPEDERLLREGLVSRTPGARRASALQD